MEKLLGCPRVAGFEKTYTTPKKLLDNLVNIVTNLPQHRVILTVFLSKNKSKEEKETTQIKIISVVGPLNNTIKLMNIISDSRRVLKEAKLDIDFLHLALHFFQGFV